jgi:PKD repeat protein
MKKLFTLVLLFVRALNFETYAQTNTTCNADFNFNISGLSVKFTPAIPTVSTTNHHYWKFDDGTFSSEISPLHTYGSAGVYTVKHYFYKSENGILVCIDSVEKRLEITTTSPCLVHAAFSFESDPTHPNQIHFTNLSTPEGEIHGVKWLFGDGTYSYDYNTAHVYSNSGLYKVCLVVQKDSTCRRDTCAAVQVQVLQPACNLIAYFAWHLDSIQLNKVHFLNLTASFESGDSIWWSFGDGTYSNDVNPTHVYNSTGSFNVCIRVKKHTAAGIVPCVKEYCKQVVITHACILEADFSFEADQSNKNKIYFKNLSSPLSSVQAVKWTFGDGSSSGSLNAEHLYEHPGTYNVCLTISGGNLCYRKICKTIEIKNAETDCCDISKFTVTRSTNNCLEFNFVPLIQNPDWKYIWTFGDCEGSLDMNPSHVYQHPGKYVVFLTVYKSATCASTTYKVVETGDCVNCNNVWPKFEYRRESTTSGRVFFHAVSNVPILSQTWVITALTDGTASPVTLIQKDLVYDFNEQGDYKVCLKVTTYGGCIKEYCEVIHISFYRNYCILKSYPNPATNQVSFNIQLTHATMIHVAIYNSLNILVAQKEQEGIPGNNLVTINIETLLPGWYNIRIVNGDRVCYSRFQKL